jgi:hypothetical protein
VQIAYQKRIKKSLVLKMIRTLLKDICLNCFCPSDLLEVIQGYWFALEDYVHSEEEPLLSCVARFEFIKILMNTPDPCILYLGAKIRIRSCECFFSRINIFLAEECTIPLRAHISLINETLSITEDSWSDDRPYWIRKLTPLLQIRFPVNLLSGIEEISQKLQGIWCERWVVLISLFLYNMSDSPDVFCIRKSLRFNGETKELIELDLETLSLFESASHPQGQSTFVICFQKRIPQQKGGNREYCLRKFYLRKLDMAFVFR